MTQNRADKERNRELIQTKALEYLADNGKLPTITWISEATDLSIKTVRGHLKKMKLAPDTSLTRALTEEVLGAVAKRAVGYEEDATHFSAYEGVVTATPYKKVVAPDVQAAKLFFQVVQGWTEKTETAVSGSLGFNFNYVVPEAPKPDEGDPV